MKKKILFLFSIICVIIVLIAGGIVGFVYFGLRGIPESHIEGNVPEQGVFDEYLSRDLLKYFKVNIKNEVTIEYELLRDQPTQVGLAAPKFYAWVLIRDSISDKIIDSGAIKVGANAKQSFTVTDYISRNEIENNPKSFESVFPQDVITKIQSIISNDDIINHEE